MKIMNIDEEGRLGGPEKRIVNVARGLRKHGLDTIVIMPVLNSQKFQQYAKDKNVKYECLDITRLSLERNILLRYIWRFPKEVILLRRVIQHHSPDLIHVNSPSQFKVAIAAWLSKTKVIWHLNNTYLNPIVKIAFNLTRQIIKPNYIYAGSGVFDYYSFLSKTNAKTSIEAPVTKKYFEISTIDKFATLLRITMIGGLNPAKGLHCLPNIVRELSQSKVNYQICLAGSVLSSQKSYIIPIQQEIASLQAKNVEVLFVGHISDTSELISQSDIILSLSEREASPTAVWEGLASGRIVLSTLVGSVKNHIKNEKNGFIIDNKDGKAIRNILEDLYVGKYKIEEISKEAKFTAVDAFSIEKIVKHHLLAYEEALC